MLILLVFERDDIEKEVLCAGTHHAKRKKSQVARVGGDLNGLEIATPGEERWETFLFPAREAWSATRVDLADALAASAA